jgi:hypothetical protein
MKRRELLTPHRRRGAGIAASGDWAVRPEAIHDRSPLAGNLTTGAAADGVVSTGAASAGLRRGQERRHRAPASPSRDRRSFPTLPPNSFASRSTSSPHSVIMLRAWCSRRRRQSPSSQSATTCSARESSPLSLDPAGIPPASRSWPRNSAPSDWRCCRRWSRECRAWRPSGIPRLAHHRLRRRRMPHGR